MKIITLDIYPESKIYIKDFIIKQVIKNNQKYVEMEDEILIDTDILIRINETKEIVLTEQIFKPIQPFELLENELLMEPVNYQNKQKKKQIKAQSRLVNNKIKNYNQRRR